ncbi:hypothetical protein ACE02P_01415 [Shewanella bicestrii]
MYSVTSELTVNPKRFKHIKTLPQIAQRFAKPNSIADVTFDDMDIIAEPPWMASRRVTEAMEFGVSATRSEVLCFNLTFLHPSPANKNSRKYLRLFVINTLYLNEI